MSDFILGWAIAGFIISGILYLIVRDRGKELSELFKECPYCKSMIPKDASVCAQCGRDIEEATKNLPSVTNGYP